jgi:anaerobic glycerol-3-phosphate dehydrogenase
MNERMHFDLVAIGGGFAGICAAVRGAELGLRTAVLEASTDVTVRLPRRLGTDGSQTHRWRGESRANPSRK